MSEYDRLGDFIAAIARPGAVWMTSGERGGGKTHTAVAIAERMVKGRFPQLPKIVVATNIIFYHKVDGQIRVEPPPGVFHIRTMRDFFPIVVDSIRTYGRDVLIVLILDEAQGFVGGDLNSTNASIPMKEFLGTIRKYNSMVWFLTPSAKQLGPAFRNLINAKTPGNLTCRWKKDLALNERWIKANGLKCTPKQLMIVRPYDHEPAFIQIPVTEWTGTVDGLEEGQYCYDHEASATFREGKGFCFNDFNDYMGGIASINAMDAIEEYYRTQIDTSEEGGATPVRSEADIERESKAKLYSRMMLSGMKQQDAADMIGVARSTLNLWCRDLGLPTKSAPKDSLPDMSGKSPKSVSRDGDNPAKRVRKVGEKRCQDSGVSSTRGSCQNGGPEPGKIYISRENPQYTPSGRSSAAAEIHDSSASGPVPHPPFAGGSDAEAGTAAPLAGHRSGIRRAAARTSGGEA